MLYIINKKLGLGGLTWAVHVPARPRPPRVNPRVQTRGAARINPRALATPKTVEAAGQWGSRARNMTPGPTRRRASRLSPQTTTLQRKLSTFPCLPRIQTPKRFGHSVLLPTSQPNHSSPNNPISLFLVGASLLPPDHCSSVGACLVSWDGRFRDLRNRIWRRV